jgi:hypothetical protein
MAAFLVAVVASSAASCGEPEPDGPAAESKPAATAADARMSNPVDPRCSFPAAPDTLHTDGRAVLLLWEFPDDAVYERFALPTDSAYQAFRAAIRADEADLEHPVSDQPTPRTEEEAELWRDENFNRDRARTGEAGSIEPIRCLDALLFAFQNARVSQLERPTEFLASVLRKEVEGGPGVAVVFGAGEEMYPPRTVYGFDAVDEYVAAGWQYHYALHNHTIQRNGDLLALGTPALSTSDVQLMRNLVAGSDLETARVTNGIFTYEVSAADLALLRYR